MDQNQPQVSDGTSGHWYQVVNKFIPILAGNQNLFGGTRLALFENKLNKRYGMFQCVTRVSKNSYILSSTACQQTVKACT